MKVIYIKDSHDAKKGDIREINPDYISFLVACGFVEEYKEPEKIAQKRQRKVKDNG